MTHSVGVVIGHVVTRDAACTAPAGGRLVRLPGTYLIHIGGYRCTCVPGSDGPSLLPSAEPLTDH